MKVREQSSWISSLRSGTSLRAAGDTPETQ
ncbi:hypothetical protein E2C01_100329 [Portunus trituberculatus]|uniref:Uncharacterized protein n=1 Tax=Portunus trituberculatus TaxID=210409 RepID=A0A5B7K6Q4_PORTR|nr:hypothetical protein [Portunus trituberculatus]